IGHGQLALLVEAVGRALGFVLELVSRTAHPGAAGIATLDHEVRNNAMKNGSAVEGPGTAFAADVIFPASLALGQFGEILGGDGSFFLKQPANDLAFRCIEDCVRSLWAAHWNSFRWFLCVVSNLGSISSPATSQGVPGEDEGRGFG